jgi:hypothetical protein
VDKKHLAIAGRGSACGCAHERWFGLVWRRQTRHGTSLEHFYVRESVCAYLSCHINCLLCEPGKDGNLARLDEVEVASVG